MVSDSELLPFPQLYSAVSAGVYFTVYLEDYFHENVDTYPPSPASACFLFIFIWFDFV